MVLCLSTGPPIPDDNLNMIYNNGTTRSSAIPLEPLIRI